MYMLSTLIVYIEHDHVETLGNDMDKRETLKSLFKYNTLNMELCYNYFCIGLELINEIVKPNMG